MPTQEFESIRAESRTFGETNDCSVKAVTLLTSLPYAEVHAAFKACGRQDRNGTYTDCTLMAIRRLGFTAMPIELSDVRKRMATEYKWPCNTLTVRQVERFPGLWDAYGKVLLKTSGHMLAVEKGTVHDFTSGSKRPIVAGWRLVRTIVE